MQIFPVGKRLPSTNHQLIDVSSGIQKLSNGPAIAIHGLYFHRENDQSNVTRVATTKLLDLSRGGAGVRAQALSRRGELIGDFRILRSAGAVHVLNAPSPAATASLAIGEAIATVAASELGL